MAPRSTAEIASFHAHVYFASAAEAEAARQLRERVGKRFAVRLGTWRDSAVGPHPQPMYQIAFASELFASLVPWLMLNHGGLSILVHPNTRHPRRDHLVDRLWIGTPLPLDETVLPEHDDKPESAGEPNTVPSIDP